MSKIQLLLAYGGESAEHEVSVASAKYVHSLLNEERYDIVLSYVDRSGRWWRVNVVEDNPKKFGLTLTLRLGNGELIDGEDQVLQPTVMLPIMLGPNGEDGAVQALGQLLHIPVAGCGILASAICMDKDVTKRLLLQAGVPVADYILHYEHDPPLDFDKVTKLLGKTVFIKPANLGSSVGISKVDTSETFTGGLIEAHKYDKKVIIERVVTGREVGCGIIGNQWPEVSVVSETSLGSNEFFTYDAKYGSDSTARMIIPAAFAPDITAKIQKIAIQAYKTLECRGFARIDLFLTDDNEVFVNELNTIPAFRPDSSYPKLWKASGLNPSALLDRVIDLALEQS